MAAVRVAKLKVEIILYLSAAVAAYLVGSINPAIILSKKLYKTDIRQEGSHNAGFTNFRRVLGSHSAWQVLFWDLAKAAAVCALFAWLFKRYLGLYHLGAAYTLFFSILGHAFPVWYGFRGGKGVAVFAGGIWFIDWRVGVIGVSIVAILLFTLKYMSLATICGAVSCPISLALFGVENAGVLVFTALSALFIVWRHRENIQRLCKGTESKFSLHG